MVRESPRFLILAGFVESEESQKNMQLPSYVTSIGDEALFKDSPAKEDCPICFLPMPIKVLCCVSLSPATITSVPIYNFADANEEVAKIRHGGILSMLRKERLWRLHTLHSLV